MNILFTFIKYSESIMNQLNNDCLLYITKYLSFQDKISFIKTCITFYKLGIYIFKNELILYNDKNQHWIDKYKPIIQVKTKKVKNIPFKSIYYLDLSNTNVQKIPKTSFKYFELDVSCNKITKIPLYILNLHHLLQLNIYAYYRYYANLYF